MASSAVNCVLSCSFTASKQQQKQRRLPSSSITGFNCDCSPSPKQPPFLLPRTTRPLPLIVVKAAEKSQTTKPNSIVCGDCDGNGAVSCSQCKGTGVNSVDHFNGQFKAGGLCWLCRGKRDILCGSCNGAGFLGGFMSTYDE